MKKWLLPFLLILTSALVKAQDDLTMNPNNKAYYSRYYDAAPLFPDMYDGGLFKYITDHVEYPQNITSSISGQINIHAIVDTTGAIVDPLVIRSISPEVDRVILKLLAVMPHSQPAIYKGHKVPVFLAVVLNVSVNAYEKTIKATRDVQAQVNEMQLAKKAYDVKPKFAGPDDNFYKYVVDNIKYPEGVKSDIDAIIQFRFTIDTAGRIKDIAISRTISKEVDQAVIDVIKSAPPYSAPATLFGKKVVLRATYSINFVVNTTLKTITAKQIPPPQPNINNSLNSGNTLAISKPSVADPNQIFTAVEVSPGYPGGENAFGQFLMNNIRYPASAKKNKVEGRVFLTFVVETDGALSNIVAVRTPSADLADEAIRVMKDCPKWTPGYQSGKPVRVQYTVPINFTLQSATR